MRLPRKTGEVDSTPVDVVTPRLEDHAEHALDEALAESFPSSDPVAVSISKPSDIALTSVLAYSVIVDLEKMNSPRPSRIIGAVLALVSMLFMQLSLAGYVCPKVSGVAPASQVMATSSMAADMPECAEADKTQPSLCQASAHTVQQSLDKHELPQIEPFAPTTIFLVLVHVVVSLPKSSFELTTVRQSGAPPPPLSIRNCCFRI